MISQLPAEILLRLCDYLGMDSIIHLASTSRSMRDVLVQYDCFDSSRVDRTGAVIDDTVLTCGISSRLVANSLYLNLANTQVTHNGLYHIVLRYNRVCCICVTGTPRFNETELARKLVIYCKKHRGMRSLTIELGLPRKRLSTQFIDTLGHLYPSLTLKRWFCDSHPLDITQYATASVNDPDSMPCHECFQTTEHNFLKDTQRNICIYCGMITCVQCRHDGRCLGCIAVK